MRQSVWGVRCHLLVQTGVESSAFRFVHPHSTTCTTQHSTTCIAQHAQHNTGQRGESDVTFWYRLVLSPLPSGLFSHIAQHSTTQHRSVWGVRYPLLVQAGTESSAFRFVHPHNTAQHNTHNTAQVSVGSCTKQICVWSQVSPFETG